MARWRQVRGSKMYAGRGGLLGPATSRRARWWVLTLSCGHEAERRVTYHWKPGLRRGGTQHRHPDEAMPPPKLVRCELCKPR